MTTRPVSHDVLTIETTPFSPRPQSGGREAGIVALSEWNVSHESSSEWEGYKLNVHRALLDSTGKWLSSERHPLDGTMSATLAESKRVAYEAGLLGYMVYRPSMAPWERDYFAVVDDA